MSLFQIVTYACTLGVVLVWLLPFRFEWSDFKWMKVTNLRVSRKAEKVSQIEWRGQHTEIEKNCNSRMALEVLYSNRKIGLFCFQGYFLHIEDI